MYKKQAKLSYALRKHNTDYSRVRENGKKGMEQFWGASNALYLDLSAVHSPFTAYIFCMCLILQ